ncbi:MAG: hypothetical protein KA383_01335 [Phycisphaerae bacterium]|nr:hypothetical protein [Phycisphaerae bacterium]
MTRRVAVAAHWAERLAHAGLPDVTDLLVRSPAARGGLGRWEALTKPGLGGRERWRWELNAADGAVLYVKRYTHTPLKEQLDRLRRQTCRHSRAWWEYQQSARLTRQYVPVVQAIAVAEDMDFALERRSVVLFEAVPGDALDRVWRRLTAAGAALTRGPARHDLTRRLARFVSAFHQSGVCHRDLYLCHIFADLDPAAGRPPRFTLIDLARTHCPRLRRTRWLLKDLAQLDASARAVAATRTDRLRFLCTYLGLAAGAPRVRWYARRIARWSNRILRRIARQAQRAAARGPAA